MKNIFISKSKDTDTPFVCICDDTGIHYPCFICGKYYDDELNSLICCVTDQN